MNWLCLEIFLWPLDTQNHLLIGIINLPDNKKAMPNMNPNLLPFLSTSAPTTGLIIIVNNVKAEYINPTSITDMPEE